MRLQLSIVCAGLLAVGPALADHRVALRTDVYTDEMLTVVSPATDASFDISETVAAAAGFSADLISGATPALVTDVVTAATEFQDRREEARAGVTVTPEPTWTIGATGTLSTESDYDARLLSATAGTELFERMAAVELSYTFSDERIGRAGDPTPRARARGHALDLSWTHILGPRTTLGLLVSGRYSACDESLGCQANPYRFVPIVDFATGAILVAPAERHPDHRTRGAAALRLRHAFFRGVALHGGTRVYTDSWGVAGYTSDAALAKSAAGNRLIARLEGRLTWQRSASFYKDDYVTDASQIEIPHFRTGDRELSSLYDVLAGARVSYRLPPVGGLTLTTAARAARIWYRYRDYGGYPERNAWLAGLGVTGTF